MTILDHACDQCPILSGINQLGNRIVSISSSLWNKCGYRCVAAVLVNFQWIHQAAAFQLFHVLFSHILGIVIPIDFHIVQRVRSTTNQMVIPMKQ